MAGGLSGTNRMHYAAMDHASTRDSRRIRRSPAEVQALHGRDRKGGPVNQTGRTCAIEGCERPHDARGWCAVHYSRWRRTGDFLTKREREAANSIVPKCPPGAKLVQLTKGFHAIVDEADFDDLSQFNWCVRLRWSNPALTPYADRRYIDENGRQCMEAMHRRVLPGIPIIDHINGNGLDNRRTNLRAATHSQNLRNLARPPRNNTSGYIGVSFHKGARKYRAYICVNRKVIYVGWSTDPAEAARRRDAAALEHYGEFVTLNFPLRVTGEVSDA